MKDWTQEFESRERVALNPQGRLFRSMGEIADDEPPDEGIPIGLRGIDNLTGGLQPGVLNLFVGYTSHGKTAGMLTTIVNNIANEVPTLFVTGDDTDVAVLYRLLAMWQGMSVSDVKAKGKRWRRDAIAKFEGFLQIAAPAYGSYNVDSLAVMMEHFKNNKGCYPELMGFDYLTLLTAQGTDAGEPMGQVRKQALAMKQFIRTFRHCTFMVGHQCNRSTLARSVRAALETQHIEYGGNQETDGVIIGFRRRRDTEILTDDDMANEAEFPTVNVNVMKNKVTGVISPHPKGYVYAIDTTSGLIRERTMEEKRGRVVGLADVRAIRFHDASLRDRYRDGD